MIKRTWEKYLNKQLYSECQLVSAINAYYFLTGKVIRQDSKKYEELVDIAKARHGSALCIGKIHEILGLKVIKKVKSLWNLFDKKGKLSLPIEAIVWHKKTGFHSVLIVDYCSKTDCLRIANFKDVTSSDGWMFREDLYQYELKVLMGDKGINSKGKRWRFRLLGL